MAKIARLKTLTLQTKNYLYKLHKVGTNMQFLGNRKTGKLASDIWVSTDMSSSLVTISEIALSRIENSGTDITPEIEKQVNECICELRNLDGTMDIDYCYKQSTYVLNVITGMGILVYSDTEYPFSIQDHSSSYSYKIDCSISEDIIADFNKVLDTYTGFCVRSRGSGKKCFTLREYLTKYKITTDYLFLDVYEGKKGTILSMSLALEEGDLQDNSLLEHVAELGELRYETFNTRYRELYGEVRMCVKDFSSFVNCLDKNATFDFEPETTCYLDINC